MSNLFLTKERMPPKYLGYAFTTSGSRTATEEEGNE